MSRPDRTRRNLLDAATLVLSKDSGASLAEVATVAGVGRTTLHRYFATREDLVRALVVDALDRVAAAIADAEPGQGSAIDALQRIADAVIPQGPSLRFLASDPSPYSAPDILRRWYDALEPVADAVRRGQRDGSIRPELPVAWVVDAYAGAILTAWDSVDEGRLARQDAPRLVMSTVLFGVAQQPGLTS
ncbi:MAG TPA: TetR/AcrR family transcriptional regulator [Actinomycetes bacterium]|nr:TetR/AcrR family transcriptional regulator [Actinomycetes bacterium]